MSETLGKDAALFGSKLSAREVLEPTSMLDLRDAHWSVRHADQANHNPPAAASAAIVRDRCFAFIVFWFLIQAFTFTFATALCADFRELAFDLERTRGILVRSAKEEE